MKYSASLLVMSTALFAAHAAQAQDTNFARDRNIAVTERIPPEYEPKGVRVGSFDISPSLDVDLDSNDNIYYQDVNKVSDTYLTLTPAVTFASDWGRHQLTGRLRASSASYADHDTENTTSWEAALGGRLDIHGNNNIFGGISYSDGFEPRYDPATPQNLLKPVEFYAMVANAGFVVEGNRLRFTGSTTLTDFDYQNATNQVGAVVSQDDRDYSRLEYLARLDYALSPDTSFYATYLGNTRDYDLNPGIHNSNGYDAAVGASFDLTNLIRGEVQVGYQSQEYDNPDYEDVDGTSFKANVQYFPTQLVTVWANTARTIQETPQIGAASYTSTASAIGADYELLRTLVLSASYGYTTDDYNGNHVVAPNTLVPIDRTDDRTALYIGAKYLVSRHIVIRGGYTYSENKSKGADSIPGYKDNAFKISLGLQY